MSASAVMAAMAPYRAARARMPRGGRHCDRRFRWARVAPGSPRACSARCKSANTRVRRPKGTASVHGTVQVGPQDDVPVLAAQLDEGPVHADAGVIDPDVDGEVMPIWVDQLIAYADDIQAGFEIAKTERHDYSHVHGCNTGWATGCRRSKLPNSRPNVCR